LVALASLVPPAHSLGSSNPPTPRPYLTLLARYAPLPDLASVFDEDANKKVFPATGIKATAQDAVVFPNFDKLHGHASNDKVRYLARVVFGAEFIAGVKRALKKKSVARFLFRTVDGFTNWANISFQVFFPIMIIFSATFVPICY
jgi:hypothetical protein